MTDTAIRSMTTLIALVIATLLAPAAVSAQDEEAADHEQAAAELTAAVLGDELMPRIHERVLGLYRDEGSGEYVVVVPSTGDVPSAADYARFGLPVRIELLDLTPEDLETILADVGDLAETLARQGPDTFAVWFDARLGRVIVLGSAPSSAYDSVAARYPGMTEYRETAPGDRLVEWGGTEEAAEARSPAVQRPEGWHQSNRQLHGEDDTPCEPDPVTQECWTALAPVE